MKDVSSPSLQQQQKQTQRQKQFLQKQQNPAAEGISPSELAALERLWRAIHGPADPRGALLP